MAWYATKPNQYRLQMPATGLVETCAFTLASENQVGGESLNLRQGHTSPEIERDTQENSAP
jgi:hypothetical protein